MSDQARFFVLKRIKSGFMTYFVKQSTRPPRITPRIAAIAAAPSQFMNALAEGMKLAKVAAENFSSSSSMNHSLHEEIASHFEEIEDRICAIGARMPPIDFPPSTFSLALVTQHH